MTLERFYNYCSQVLLPFIFFIENTSLFRVTTLPILYAREHALKTANALIFH